MKNRDRMRNDPWVFPPGPLLIRGGRVNFPVGRIGSSAKICAARSRRKNKKGLQPPQTTGRGPLSDRPIRPFFGPISPVESRSDSLAL